VDDSDLVELIKTWIRERIQAAQQEADTLERILYLVAKGEGE
jgi:hypothetical protein